MPLTPMALLPVSLTSDSLKQILKPLAVTSAIFFSPSVSFTPISSSSSFKVIAWIPTLRIFAKWLKGVAGKNFDKRAVNYALFEILAEYKRCGAAKMDVYKAMLIFNPFFLVKEVIRRKKTARGDIEKCKQVAKNIGLKQISGTKEFPIFEKQAAGV